MSVPSSKTAPYSPSVSDSGAGPDGLRRRLLAARRTPRLLALCCLTVTVVLFLNVLNFERGRAEVKFAFVTDASAQRMQMALERTGQAVLAIAAQAAMASEVKSADIEAYVESLGMAKNYPQIEEIRFIRAGVLPGAHGTVTKVALARAAQTGGTVLSGKLSAQDRFLLVRAVFAPSKAPGARKPLLGWAVATFDAGEVLTGLPETGAPLFALTVTQASNGEVLASTQDVAAAEQGTRRRIVLSVLGETWLLDYAPAPRFLETYLTILPDAVLTGGLGLTLFLWGVLGSNARRSAALEQVAAQRNKMLQARDQENRALSETTVSVVLVLDGSGLITFANAAAAELFQCPREAFLGKPLAAFVWMRTDVDAHDLSNARGRLPNGTPLMLDLQSNSWRNAEGVENTTVLLRDVSAQYRGQCALEAMQQRYDTALTGARIGIFEIDLLTGDAQMSQTWHRILGTDTLDVPFNHQQHFMARVHPDDLPHLVEADRKCLSGETPRSVAEYRVRFGSEWRWMYSDAVAVEGPQGQGPVKLIGTQADVTDLRRARDALALSEARFRMVLEDAPVGMAVLSEKGEFLSANAALADMCGYDVAQLCAQMRLADLLSRQDFVTMSHEVRALLRSEDIKTYQSQMLLRTRSGELRWGLFNLSWTYDAHREAYVYIAQINDISDQKRVERIKSEFVSTVSHELRTPLTSIKGALALLEASTRNTLPDGARRLLEIASVNADRLTQMVNDILDLEKLTSGEVSFEREPAALDDLVRHTLQEMAPLASQCRNTIIPPEGGLPLEVFVDVGRVRQVIGNIVSNACKFSYPDTPVTVRHSVQDQQVTTFVENIGPPVKESFRAHMFEPFTQADASDTRSKGGTGLGLNIAQQIVQAMGGEIGFEQRAGETTVFWFTLPLAPSGGAGPVPRTIASSFSPVGHLQILHVEDDSDFVDVIATGFTGIAQITPAASLREARHTLPDRHWDVVLLDWTLPDGSGGSLLAEIEKLHPQAVVIGLTAGDEAQADPRVTLCLTKSQIDIAHIVQRVTQAATAGRTEPVQKAAG